MSITSKEKHTVTGEMPEGHWFWDKDHRDLYLEVWLLSKEARVTGPEYYVEIKDEVYMPLIFGLAVLAE